MIQPISFSNVNFKSNRKATNTASKTNSGYSRNKLDASLNALEKLADAQKAIQDAQSAINLIVNEEKKELMQDDLAKKAIVAFREYNQRLDDNLSLSERLDNIVQNESGNFGISQVRQEQLQELSDEQIAALDDKMLRSLAVYSYSSSGTTQHQYNTKLNHFDFLKSLTPEEIVKIQANSDCRHDLLSIMHGWKTSEKAREIMEHIKTAINS